MTEPDRPADPVLPVRPGNFLLELVLVPVSDIDRAKAFYSERAGFGVDVDVRPADGVRVVQLTPPGSACSISLVSGIPGFDMPPGSLRGLHLVVSDIEAARLLAFGLATLLTARGELAGKLRSRTAVKPGR